MQRFANARFVNARFINGSKLINIQVGILARAGMKKGKMLISCISDNLVI